MPYIGNPIYQSAFVTDQFSGTGSQTAFTMSVAPAGTSNVLVIVSGVVQDPSTYGVVGNTLTFSAAPPSGTGNISCRYLGVPVTGVTTTAYRTVTEFTATASQTTFTPPSYSVGFINVYLNGVLLGSADYTATNGTTVVLTTGASAGNLVTVESFQISSVANAIQNTAGAVSSSNIATGAVTTAKLASTTGSGAVVLSTSPTLVTPALGTPSSVVLTNATGLPASAMAYSGAPVKISTYENTTRIVTPTQALYTAFTWTFTKSYGTSTNVIIQGAIPAWQNNNDGYYWFINIDGTYKYVGIVAPESANSAHMISVLQNWTGLSSGVHTVSFGWNAADGTANRQVNVIHPNVVDDARNQQTGSVFIITEVIA